MIHAPLPHWIYERHDIAYGQFWTMEPKPTPGVFDDGAVKQSDIHGTKHPHDSPVQAAIAIEAIALPQPSSQGHRSLPLCISWELPGLRGHYIQGSFKHTTGKRESIASNDAARLRRWLTIHPHIFGDTVLLNVAQRLTGNPELAANPKDGSNLSSPETLAFWGKLLSLELESAKPDRYGAGAPYPLPTNAVEYRVFASPEQFLSAIGE